MQKWEQALGAVTKQLTRFKYPILVLFAGFVLLALGTGGAKPASAPAEPQAEGTAAQGEAFDLEAFEARLEAALSQIDGAGRVKLTLSLKATEEAVYAADIRQAQQGQGGSSYESALSIVSDGSYGEQPILVKNLYPTFRGALVLCDGADDVNVRLAVTQAVGAMCGVGADKVSVIKMQQ